MKVETSVTASQTRENLMSAFWSLYKENRIEKITVASICKVAGYNRSTFYAYFQDIYEVLDAIEEELISPEAFEKSILSFLLSGSSFASANKEMAFQHIIRLFEDSCDYIPVLLGEHGDPAFRQKLMDKLTPHITALLKYNLEDNKEMQYILEYQSAGVLNVIAKWYANGKNIPYEDLVRLLMNLSTKGMQNEIFSNLENRGIRMKSS